MCGLHGFQLYGVVNNDLCKIMKKEQTYPQFQNAVGTLFQLPYLVRLHSQTMNSYYILHVIVLSASRIKRGRPIHLIVTIIGNGDGFTLEILSNLFSFTVL